MGNLSFSHLLLILILLLIFFGPSKLPQLGQSLGKAIRGFKDGLSELDGEARNLPPKENPQQQLNHDQQARVEQSQHQTTDQKKS